MARTNASVSETSRSNPAEALPSPAPQLTAVEVDDGCVVYDPVERSAHTLNQSAAKVWWACAAGATVGELEELVGRTGGVLDDALWTLQLLEAAALVDRHVSRPVRVFGRPIEIAAPGDAAVAALDGLLEPMQTSDPPMIRVRVAGPVEQVLDHAVTELNRIAADTPDLLVLHAGAVEIGSHVVALVGEPGAGKSTLTAALVREGARYLTDEALGVHHDLTTVEHPKPLAIESGARDLFPGIDERLVDARRLSSEALRPRAAQHLSVVVVPRFEPGAATSMSALPPADALRVLLGCTFNLHAFGDAGLETLDRIARLGCVELRHSDLTEACAAIGHLADGTPQRQTA